MTLAEDFKQAVKKVYESGEIEKINKTLNNYEFTRVRCDEYIRQEKIRLKNDKEFLDFCKENGFDEIPFMILLMELQSTELFRDIIVFMKGGL